MLFVSIDSPLFAAASLLELASISVSSPARAGSPSYFQSSGVVGRSIRVLHPELIHLSNTNRQSLSIFEYVGHASIDTSNGLRLTSSSGKKIWWSFLSVRTLHPPSDSEGIELFGFLDCCYAGAATRSNPTRSIQILAACGPKEVARSRAMSITFTQRFCGEVERAQKFHRGKVSIPELFQRLQETKTPGTPNPELSTLSGLAPIVIPLKKLPGPGSPRPSRVPAWTTLPDPDE
jgi:hypothetical protein